MRQVAQARNNIFRALRIDKNAPLSECTLAELRDESPLKKKANSFGKEREKLHFLAAVDEYSGALGGILLQLEHHISIGHYEHALLAFDDFLAGKEIGDVVGKTTSAGDAAMSFFARLRTLVGNGNETASGLGQELAGDSIKEQATAAQNLLRNLYHLDFWSEEERVKLTSS